MQPLNDSNAFTVAKSIKLGRDASDSRLPGGKTPYSSALSPKEKYECVKDSDCAGALVCHSNKCIDSCTGVTCPGGQKCSTGKCIPCSLGEICGCSDNVSNGSGACFDPCNPNKCASTTPNCIKSGANYSCACTSTSCGAGKKCSGSSCINCAANESCNCPSGQKANGSGGCATVACSSNSDCGAGKQCANAGTTSAYCYNCSANAQCTCPSGQLADGSGSCVKPVCYDNTPCGAGRQCIDGGKYNAACDPCPPGSQCTCPSGQVADGSGGCVTEGCSDGYVSFNGECRKVGCPSGYGDPYEMVVKGADCTLSSGGELLHMGGTNYNQCAKCTAKKCTAPWYDAEPATAPNCVDLSIDSTQYSWYYHCSYCMTCRASYYPNLGICVPCPANATCDGTNNWKCNKGYTKIESSQVAGRWYYTCKKSSTCSCTAKTSGTIQVNSAGSGDGYNGINFCSDVGVSADCSYTTVGTYIRVNSANTVLSSGDTRISCYGSGGTATCKHNTGGTFTVTGLKF